MNALLSHAVEKHSQGKASVLASEVSYSFPDRLVLEGMRLRVKTKESELCTLVNSLILQPGYAGLLKGYLPVTFFAVFPYGGLDGQCGISIGSGLRDSFALVAVNQMDLAGINAIPMLFKRELKGVMEGNIELRGDLRSILRCRGEGNLFLTEGSISTRLGFPGLNEIPYSSMEFIFKLDKETVTFEKAQMRGTVFSGDFKGTIKLNEVLEKSLISVQGTVQPGKEIRDNPFFGRLIGKALKGKDTIPVEISGTLKAPKITRREN